MAVVDSLSDVQFSFTPYHYVYNNPINFIDTTGIPLNEDEEQIGADGLTNSQWIDASHPGNDPGLFSYYLAIIKIALNRKEEIKNQKLKIVQAKDDDNLNDRLQDVTDKFYQQLARTELFFLIMKETGGT